MLRAPSGKLAYVEVKSCIPRGWVAKFPDRSTERGRRQLELLKRLAARGSECHIVFVVQRPDARKFRPFVEIDPRFSELLEEAENAGVEVRAVTTRFRPPNLYLAREPVEVGLAYLG